MSNILFNDEQQKQLGTNHWVKSVTEKSISFLGDYKNYIKDRHEELVNRIH